MNFNFLDKMKKLDLWTNPNDGQKEDLPIPKGNTWFAHPIYFINHLDKAGLLDKSFNPYEGNHTQTTQGFQHITFNSVDSPGFAPFIGTNSSIENFNGYTYLTWDFNSRHPGLDFFGVRNGRTPIHSLINGRIVHQGNHGDEALGIYLIIQNMRNESQFYLLGHLHPDLPLPIRTIVHPGMTVAHVSNTGNVRSGGNRVNAAQRRDGLGTHLHLQLVIEPEELDEILGDNGHPNFAHIESKSYDPFNHGRAFSSLPRT